MVNVKVTFEIEVSEMGYGYALPLDTVDDDVKWEIVQAVNKAMYLGQATVEEK